MVAYMATQPVAGHPGTPSSATTLAPEPGAATTTPAASAAATAGTSSAATAAISAATAAAATSAATASRTLHDVPVRGTAILVDIVDHTIGPAVKYRLTELGLRIGEELTIVQKTSGNGRLVAIGTVHYAMDKRTCRAIMVEGDF